MNSLDSDENQGGGNTILPLKKHRSWCFTINNHSEKIWNSLTQLKSNFEIKKIIFQEEKGKNGIPHIQGIVQFENQIMFKTLKKMYPTAHWEVCRSIKGSIKYCSKEDTRCGKSYSHGIEKKELFEKRNKVKYGDKALMQYAKDQHNWNNGYKDIMSFEVYRDIVTWERAESS